MLASIEPKYQFANGGLVQQKCGFAAGAALQDGRNGVTVPNRE
jgi:hypothetical protein